MDSLEKLFFRDFGYLFPGHESARSEFRPFLGDIRFRELEQGGILLREGDTCKAVPFVMRGCIRVFKTADTGREITLYRIQKKQSCVLSSGCISGAAPFPATAMVEMPTAAAFLPALAVRRLFEINPAFRDFVFVQYSQRLSDIIELVEEVAFRHVDQRLKEWISARRASAGLNRIKTTHQEIADHIGTSREVISRILKDWEQRGAVELSRGEILLLEPFDSLSV
jgi:CRP/FNR family transcriptional regulator, anaerobic regulatory protein